MKQQDKSTDFSVAQVVAAFAVALFAIAFEVAIHYAEIVNTLREIPLPGCG